MKSRRALSTVVGAIFFIIAVSSVIAYVTISMEKIDELAQAVITTESQNQDRFAEAFQVTKVRTDLNKFNITIQNTGNIPIQIGNLWVENKSATDWIRKYAIGESVPPGGILSNIGQSLGLTAVDTNSYKMKLVTERGNAQEFSINSASEQPLNIQIQTIPATITTGFKTTAIMTVTNNMSDNNVLMNIQPNIQAVSGGASVDAESSITPSSYDFLKQGDTAIFKKTFTLSGEEDQTKTIEASLQNGYPLNTATETVTIDVVEFTLQSATSLDTIGFSVGTTVDNSLILHEETSYALDGRQLYDGDPENPTTLDTSSTQSYLWYTKNGTSSINVPAGTWNLNLRFVSDEVPDGIGPPDLIYHFESEVSQTTPDSSGNNADLNVNGASIGSNGQHGTQGYSFNGLDDYLSRSDTDTFDNIDAYPDSTSGWFKTSDSSSGQKTIFRVGTGNEYYEGFVDAGIFYFQFTSAPNKSPPQGLCWSDLSTNLANGNWQHFVAVRDDIAQCRVYINGTLSAGGIDTTQNCGNCNGGRAKVDTSGGWNIGRDPTGSGQDYFPGEIDQIFHWNGYEITPSEASLMSNANYGSDAHSFDFRLEKVDEDGDFISVIKNDLNTSIQFWDGFGSATAWSTGNLINYTTGSLSAQIFSSGERLRLNMTHVGGLDMTIRIDDPGLNDPHPTYLDLPDPSPTFPSYFELDNDDNPSVTIFNQGPDGAWLTYLTRMVFDDISSTNSYAAHINTVCGSGFSPNDGITRDSPLIKVNQTCTLDFEIPCDVPDVQSCTGTTLPPGQYDAAVFMSGYDEDGELFTRTTELGTITVVD